MLQKIRELTDSFQKFFEQNWRAGLAVFVVFTLLSIAWHYFWRLRLISLNNKAIADFNKKCKLYELKFPLENLKSPKAMEQVFASLWGIFSFGLNNRQIWWEGDVESWLSLELVGRGTHVSFYIRVKESQKNVVEAAFFSQYPEMEIREVPDYVNDLPDVIPNDIYDLDGVDLLLARKDAYPIKTYDFFESPAEEKELDPMATLVEAASGLKEEELMLVQILIRPINDDTNPEKWRKEGKKIIHKITGFKEPPKPPGVMAGVVQFFSNLWVAANPLSKEELAWGVKKEEKPLNFKTYGPGEIEEMKAIEEKMSKSAFDTIIRLLYIDRKDSYSGKNFGAMMAAFGQFGTGNFNTFRPNMATLTKGTKVGGHSKAGGKWPWNMFFRKARLLSRKKKFFHAYKTREMPQYAHSRPSFGILSNKNYTGHYHKLGDLHLYTSVLCSHELATIFHPPGQPIVGHKVGQMPAKKAGAPIGLPIIE